MLNNLINNYTKLIFLKLSNCFTFIFNSSGHPFNISLKLSLLNILSKLKLEIFKSFKGEHPANIASIFTTFEVSK